MTGDSADRAADLEQRYVAEHAETEELLEGLDPDAPSAERTTDQVKAAAADGGKESEVDEMADPER